jgi:hypothetical protein
MSKNVKPAVTGEATGSKGASDGQVLIGSTRNGGTLTGKGVGPGQAKPVPTMAMNSKDGKVVTPNLEDSQGWYPNRGVREVED